MNQKYQVRTFQEHDQDAVYTLILSVLESEFRDLPPDSFLSDVRDVDASYSGEGNEFFVCEHENQIIGTAAIKRDDDKSALLRRFFVNPHFRGRRVGRQLVETVIAYARKQGYKRLDFVGNSRMHKVQAVLKKIGFTENEDVAIKGLELFKLSYKL